MAISGTVPVTGPVAPTSTADTYPSHLAQYGKGGLHTVQSLAERDAIPSARREAGMYVYIIDTGAYWKLANDLTTWNPVSISGTGDMSKSIYDTNDDGKVNEAEAVPWAGVTGAAAGVTALTDPRYPRYDVVMAPALDETQKSRVCQNIGALRTLTGVIDVALYTVGDGVADDTAGLQQALDAVQNGGQLTSPPGRRYKTTAPVLKPICSAITVDLQGSIIDFRGTGFSGSNKAAFRLGGIRIAQPGLGVSNLTTPISINVSTRTYTVVGTTALNIAVGEGIILYNDIDGSFNGVSGGYYPGWYAVVESVSGNDITFDRFPLFAFTAKQVYGFYACNDNLITRMGIDLSNCQWGVGICTIGVNGGVTRCKVNGRGDSTDSNECGIWIEGHNMLASENRVEYIIANDPSCPYRGGYCMFAAGTNLEMRHNDLRNAKHCVATSWRRALSEKITFANNYCFQRPDWSNTMSAGTEPICHGSLDYHGLMRAGVVASNVIETGSIAGTVRGGEVQYIGNRIRRIGTTPPISGGGLGNDGLFLCLDEPLRHLVIRDNWIESEIEANLFMKIGPEVTTPNLIVNQSVVIESNYLYNVKIKLLPTSTAQPLWSLQINNNWIDTPAAAIQIFMRITSACNFKGNTVKFARTTSDCGAIEFDATFLYYDHPLIIECNNFARTNTTNTYAIKIVAPGTSNNLSASYIYRDNQSSAQIFSDLAPDFRTPPDYTRVSQSAEGNFLGNLYRIGNRWAWQATDAADVPQRGVFGRMEFVANRNSAVTLKGWYCGGTGERLGAVLTTKAAWAPTTAYSRGDQTALANGKVLICTVAGNSGSTEPSAPANFFAIVTDGTCTWKYIADGKAVWQSLT